MAGTLQYLKAELQRDVAPIGLNRPGRRYAIPDAFIAEPERAVDRAESHAKGGVLCGNGPYPRAGWDMASSTHACATDAGAFFFVPE